VTESRKARLWHPYQTELARAPLFFVFCLTLTVVLLVVLALTDRHLKSAVAPNGIVSFEFAGTVDRAREIVQSWGSEAKPFASFSLGIDYLYMVAYSTTIGLACIWASRMLKTRQWPLAGVGIPLAWGQLLAAGLDALENVALLVLLLVQVAPPWPQVAWGAAGLKFALVIGGLLYSAYGVVAWLVGRMGQVQLAQ
jgi:hypothetical protein